MKKILTLVLVSALGGVFTLGAYKLFLEEENEDTVIVTTNNEKPTFLPTSNVNTFLNAAENTDFIAAAQNTVDAVVHVKNVSLSSGQYTFQDFFSGRNSQRKQMGTGSGVIINTDGYIITNNHVIKDALELSVTLNNNNTYKAEVVGTDPKTDIALLKINPEEELPYVTFGDSDSAKIGEWVLAVGNPFNLTSTVTAGIISAKSRDLTGGNSQSFIQTDAAVNPGNSGGALVNTKGELIGINTAITSQTGSYIGYSFAVPSNIARKVIEDIMEFGNVQNGILGIRGGTFNSDVAKEVGVSYTEGVYVGEVTKNSGAEAGGIKKGDIIKKLDNITVSRFEDLSGYIKTKRPNDIVNVELIRDNKLKTVAVTLSKPEVEVFTVDFMQMELQGLTETYKKENEIDYGVLVKDSRNSWLSNKVGISRGYIITAVNGYKIETIEDISKLKKKYGDNMLENLNKLEYINTENRRKELIFR